MPAGAGSTPADLHQPRRRLALPPLRWPPSTPTLWATTTPPPASSNTDTAGSPLAGSTTSTPGRLLATPSVTFIGTGRCCPRGPLQRHTPVLSLAGSGRPSVGPSTPSGRHDAGLAGPPRHRTRSVVGRALHRACCLLLTGVVSPLLPSLLLHSGLSPCLLARPPSC
ncbi:hypothetical protein ZWY2020_024893 [Hordeum vulgare]|nr:hypothetical protein ZWY2020_024893 [Hordeum vulgare]